MARAYYDCPQCGESIECVADNRKKADRFALYKKRGGEVCHACQRKAFDAQNAAAAERAKSSNLPTLSGSDKQIAWAESIREKCLENLEAGLASVESERRSEIAQLAEHQRAECLSELTDALALIAVEIRSTTDARVWIDTRLETGHAIKIYIERLLGNRAATLLPLTTQALDEYYK